MDIVGKNVMKVDGLALACGTAEFAADISLTGMLHARVLRSPHAHAVIRSIDTTAAAGLEGVHAVLTHKELPRVRHTTAGQGYPEPSPYDTLVLDDKVRFVGDRVAALAAETPQLADQALKLIGVRYEVLEPVFEPEEALKPGAPVIHDEPDARTLIPIEYEPGKNMAAHVTMEVGSVGRGFEKAGRVLERTFVTHYAQHCPIEPHVVVCYLDDRYRLVIRTSTQVPFHARRIVSRALQFPLKRIRVVKPRIGGGFGAKQEVLLEQLCAALTLKTRRPVKLEFTRAEEFVSSRTRHPITVRLKGGVSKTGELTAMDMGVLGNTGAYGSHAMTVICNCGSKTLPLYRCDNVRFEATAAYTNLPVAGAYRGYGVTQAAFAQEVLMDELAEAIGMDPLELRRANHIRSGETSPLFKALGEGREGVEQRIGSCGLEECLTRGAEAIGWEKKRGRRPRGTTRRGVGMACLMQGSSIPRIDMASASLKLNDDGSFNLLIGATDLGTGSDTVLAQIAAETLATVPENIITYSSDTDMTPFDTGAYASSTTYLSGMAVLKAARQVKEQLVKVGVQMLGVDPADASVCGEHVVCARTREKVSYEELALRSLYNEDQFQIAATASHVSQASPPPFAAHFAEVEVDTETGFVRVVKYVAAVDCGTAIQPRLAEGQTEGAVLNGISYALTEEFFFDGRGRVRNDNFNHYKLFTTRDLPEIVTILVPTYEDTGPYGAKSVSEISINGPLPAISNALHDAIGCRMRQAPFTPEKVLRQLRRGG